MQKYRWSFTEKGENFTDSDSSTPEFMFEYTYWSLPGEVYSNMDLGVLKLKLLEVHFANKFSGAELARQRRTAKCTKCSFNPNVNKEGVKYPDAKLASD